MGTEAIPTPRRTVGAAVVGNAGAHGWSMGDNLVAVEVVDPNAGTTDIWICEVERGVRTRFTFGPAADESPLWSPDGASIMFWSDRNGPGDFYMMDASGAGFE